MSRELQEKPAAASQAGDADKPKAASKTASKATTRTAARKPAAAVKKTPAKQAAARKPVAPKKPAAKAPAKTVKQPVAPKPAAPKPAAEKSVKSTKLAKPAAKEKLKKPKLVRDSFTMPESEYQVLGDVKKAFLKIGISVKKSELLRAGVALIKAMEIAKLKTVIADLPPIKAGRPKKDK